MVIGKLAPSSSLIVRAPKARLGPGGGPEIASWSSWFETAFGLLTMRIEEWLEVRLGPQQRHQLIELLQALVLELHLAAVALVLDVDREPDAVGDAPFQGPRVGVLLLQQP